jgi:DNA-binding LacI/PurR family transcriptional regulator
MLALIKNQMKAGQITIKDIAKQLNVSPSTVSRALQNHPDISPETKKLVNELAIRLKYQPNIVALGLKQRRSNTIGVIIPEMVHFFFSQVISGIEDVAYQEGYTVMTCQSNERYDREVNNARTLIAHRVEGILVSVSKETMNGQHLTDIQENGIPLVFFDRIFPGIDADRVVNNDREAAYEATCHLAALERKRIAHFAGPQNLVIGKERKAGYIQALKVSGLDFDPSLCIEADTFEKAFREIIQMKNTGNVPDALFCINDLTAIGAIKSLRELGFKVPEDVAVVGFSDGIFAQISDPLLSSVDQHGYEMGMQATRLLLDRIKQKEDDYPFVTKVLKGDLIIRNSSKDSLSSNTYLTENKQQ